MGQPVAAQAATDPGAAQPPVSPTIANLSAQIVQQSGQKSSRFDVQLTPDGLGRVDVAVQIDASGKVTAALSFEKSASAALVKDRAGDLQAALASSGLTLAPDALRITHSQADAGFAAAAGADTMASQTSPQGGGGQNGQGGQPPTPQQFAAGGRSFQQGQQQPQQERAPHAAPAFGNARSFEAAASAADAIDRRSAHAGGLATRGLDIRI